MSDIINVQCQSCGEYIPADSETCSYCGEMVTKENFSDEDKDIQEINFSTSKLNGIVLILILIPICIIVMIGVFYLLKTFNPDIDIADRIHAKPNKEVSSIKKENNSKSGTLEEAETLLKDKNYDKSALILQNLIDNKTNEAEAYYNMAQIYEARNFKKLAINTYKKSIELKTNYFEPNKKLTLIYIGEYNYEEAKIFGEKAISINSKDYDLLKAMLQVYSSSTEKDKIIELYKKITKIKPKDIDANAVLADYYLDKENYRASIPYLKNLLAIKYNTNISYTLAYCYAKIEHYSDAIRVLDKVIANDDYEYYRATRFKENMQLLKDEYIYRHSAY